jgi:hypothetical protein
MSKTIPEDVDRGLSYNKERMAMMMIAIISNATRRKWKNRVDEWGEMCTILSRVSRGKEER